MTRTLMLLSNAFRPDPRVGHEAAALVENSHEVTVVCWDRTVERPARETYAGAQIERVHSVRSAYGSGVKQLLYTPRFWRAAVQRGLELRPEVVHCHDLDTLYAGVQLKGRLGCKLIYDAHEDYPALMSLYLPAPFVSALSLLERQLLRRVDSTITASTVFADKLRGRGVQPVTTIGNVQPLAPFEAISDEALAQARARLGLTPNDYVIAYIGGFSRNRELLPLVEAARRLPEAHFLLWGDGHQRAAVEAAAAEVPNLRYLGWLPAEQVPLHTRLADVIYYCLRADYPGAVYNAPNTLANAMAAGTPVLANDVGDLGRIVCQEECGYLLAEVTPAAIQVALLELRDPQLRQRLGQAGRQAAEREYNWNAAAERLAQVYRRILNG